MKRMFRTLAVVTTAVAVMAAPGVANATPALPDRSGLQEQLDKIEPAGAVGALARVRDEHGVWRGTTGVGNLKTKQPVPAYGRFRAGSISKTFLATVVLQLADKGKLKLDDPIERYLPGVVPNGQEISLRELLNHTSGLYDFRQTLAPFPPDPGFLQYRWRTWTPEEQVQRALANPPTHVPPGSKFKYSNTNYTLLGMVVEKVTGESYADEIERRIIRKLKLVDTEMPGTDPRIRGPHARGYLPVKTGDGPPELIDFTEMNPSLFGVGGELISSARDLEVFVTALLDGTLLRPNMLKEMKTQGDPKGREYGLGLAWRTTPCGVKVYGNDGDAIAYQAWAYATEDLSRKVTVAVTPDLLRGDSDDAVDAFIDKAVCS